MSCDCFRSPLFAIHTTPLTIALQQFTPDHERCDRKSKKKLSDLSDDYHCDRTTLLMIVLAIPNFDSRWVSRLVHT